MFNLLPVAASTKAKIRIRQKLRLLAPWRGQSPVNDSFGLVGLSECDDCQNVHKRLNAIEAKLDLLIGGLVGAETPPQWFKNGEDRLLVEIRGISDEFQKIENDKARLKHDLEHLADGADRFLASVRQKLTKPQCDLFFELIATVEDAGTRRVKSYAEIGKRLGISKQAVQQQYRRMAERIPTIDDYVDAIRHPKKPRNFSEMSPSERRKTGVDSSYDQ